MKKEVWLFAASGEPEDDEILIRFAQYVSTAGRGGVCYVLIPENANPGGVYGRVGCRYVVTKNTAAHLKLLSESSFLFVARSVNDALCLAWPYPRIPVVMIPGRNTDPAVDVSAGAADNCLFRYVSENAEITQCLKGVKQLRDYQIVQLEGLYSADDSVFVAAADALLSNLCRSVELSFAFLGFALTHVGGTPMATHALAEGLLECGARVEYLSVRQTARSNVPPGVVSFGADDLLHQMPAKCPSFLEWLPKRIMKSYLRYDPGDFPPACGLIFKRMLAVTRAKNVISTREPMHLFLNAARNPNISKRIYIFHCSSRLILDIFAKAVDLIRKMRIDCALFVTEANRVALKDEIGIFRYRRYSVVGNGLPSNRMIEESDIMMPEFKAGISLCWLVRIETDRKRDFDRMFEFAEYLRKKGQDGIHIDVYGKGAYLEELEKKIEARGVNDIIRYAGVSMDVCQTYSEYDAVVDFTEIQSFGMVYIEAVLNGKMVFCRRNEGSLEVLKDMPNAYFDSNEDLHNKLIALRDITINELKRNYRLVYNRFSRGAIVRRLLDCAGIA